MAIYFFYKCARIKIHFYYLLNESRCPRFFHPFIYQCRIKNFNMVRQKHILISSSPSYKFIMKHNFKNKKVFLYLCQINLIKNDFKVLFSTFYSFDISNIICIFCTLNLQITNYEFIKFLSFKTFFVNFSNSIY